MLDIAEERISGHEDIAIETIHNETEKRELFKKMNRKNIWRNNGQFFPNLLKTINRETLSVGKMNKNGTKEHHNQIA